MIDIRELRYGCHVLVGKDLGELCVPKHYAMVTSICDGFILCKTEQDQEVPDRYDVSDIEGIPIEDIIPYLEHIGFTRSKLNASYYKQDITSNYRIVIDLRGSCACSRSELIQRTGVKYLHQMESCISDAGVELELNILDNGN